MSLGDVGFLGDLNDIGVLGALGGAGILSVYIGKVGASGDVRVTWVFLVP